MNEEIKIVLPAVRTRDLDKLNLVKLAYGGKVLGSSQFLLLPQLPQKATLRSKLVKNDSKLIISIYGSKSLTHSVVI